jgi:predicted molibdopterin-dependent oxidoreductase YjgC
MFVNGHAVTPAAGWSILDAARAVDISVPTLCHHLACRVTDRAGSAWCRLTAGRGFALARGHGLDADGSAVSPGGAVDESDPFLRFDPGGRNAAAEVTDGVYPLTPTTGRVLEHYHGGSMSRRVAGLHALVPEAVAELHPADAAGVGIAEGDQVRLTSRRGSVCARARLIPGIARGTVFLPFHFTEAAANELTIAALDPVAKIPE